MTNNTLLPQALGRYPAGHTGGDDHPGLLPRLRGVRRGEGHGHSCHDHGEGLLYRRVSRSLPGDDDGSGADR